MGKITPHAREQPSPSRHSSAPLQGRGPRVLLGQRHEYGSKGWIEDQLVVVVKMALRGRPASQVPSNPQPAIPRNPALAVSALMSIARLKGYIVEKKQSLAGKLDLGKLSPADLRAVLEGSLDQLAPGERQRLIGIADGTIDAEPLDS